MTRIRIRMKRAKLSLVLLLFATVVVSIGSVVFANSPGPVASVHIDVENLPVNVAYIDVLVNLPESDNLYVACNDWITRQAGLSENSEMVRYNAGGYRSYAAHVKGAEPLKNLSEGTPATHYELTFWKYQYQEMKDLFPYIKIALVDASGAILRISPIINVNPFRNAFYGRITVDGASGRVNVDQSINFFGLTLYMIFYLFIPWAITVGTETMIGYLVQIRPVEDVFIINSISNLSMNWLIFLTLLIVDRAFLPIPVLAALEAGVVVFEFLMYRKRFRTIPSHRLMAFSIGANAVSLMIGLGVNFSLFNVWGL